MAAAESVNIFAYLDYRAALRDLSAYKKAHEYGFSHRAVSKRAGFRSTNFLKLVMEGKRNLSADAAAQFAKAFGLEGASFEFFCELVTYNQAKTSRERSKSYERLTRCRPEKALHQLEAHQSAYHSSWYIPAIRELAARADFREDPQFIARQLIPTITPAKAKKALETLLTLGLLRRTAEGRLVPAEALVTTGTSPQSHHLADFHRAMIEQASESIDRFPASDREIASLTLCVDERLLPALKLKLQAFRREFMQFAEGSGVPERVVQVNFQMFPLSKRCEEIDP